MDANTLAAIAGLALTSGTGLISVTIYAVNTRSLAKSADGRARTLEQGLSVFARKETIEPQLKLINAALARIEGRQDDMMSKFMGGGA